MQGLAQTALTWDAKVFPAVDMATNAAVGMAETNWKHKVTPDQGDLIKNYTTVSIYPARIVLLTKYIP